MYLIKLTDKGATGNLFVVDDEVLFVDWDLDRNDQYYKIDHKLQLHPIDKAYYASKTLGPHYPIIERQLSSPLEHYVITKGLEDTSYCSSYQENKIIGFDGNGRKVFEWDEDLCQGHALHDIKFQPPYYLWLTFPTGQTVIKFSLMDNKEVFRIENDNWNYNDFEVLSYPESLWIDDNYLYIPNMGSHKIYKLDLFNYQLSNEIALEEQPWQYVKSSIGTFVVTEAGIYCLRK